MGDLTDRFNREAVAAKLHDLWVSWSRDVVFNKLSNYPTPSVEYQRLLSMWASLWVPFDQLTEERKDIGRELAQQIIDIIR